MAYIVMASERYHRDTLGTFHIGPEPRVPRRLSNAALSAEKSCARARRESLAGAKALQMRLGTCALKPTPQTLDARP